MQCMTVAIENPPKKGEYKVFNQFEEVYDLTELALRVQKVGNELGLDVEVRNPEKIPEWNSRIIIIILTISTY